MEYTVIPYNAGLERQTARLHAGLLNAHPGLSRSYLHWKYHQNPFIADPILNLVLYGSRVVAMRGLFGTAWQLEPDADPTVLPHADDLVVHPYHRNRGLFLVLNQALARAAGDRGYPCIVSLSAGETTQNLQSVAGWKTMGELERIYRTPRAGIPHGGSSESPATPRLRGVHRLEKARRLLGFGPGRPPSNQSVGRVLDRMATRNAGPVLASREADLAAMAVLAEAVAPPLARSVRNESFLRWRLANPHRRYRFLFWRDSRLRGYMVLAWAARDPERVIIADHAVEDDAVLDDFLQILDRSPGTEYRLMSSTLPAAHASRFRVGGFASDPAYARDQRRRFQYLPLPPAGGSESGQACPDSYPGGWRVHLLDTMGA